MVAPRLFPVLVALATSLIAQNPPQPGANRPDESRIDRYSLDHAVAFVDTVATTWGRRHSCVTCHTNGLHLISRAWSGRTSAALDSNRAFARAYLKSYIEDGRKPSGRKGQVEGLVATAAMLAIGEMKTGKKLSKAAASGLTWALGKQDAQGHWPGWLKCGWPPFEVDDHYGVTLVAVAIGMSPPAFRRREPIRAGVDRLRRYLRKRPPQNPHQKGMMIWAAQHLTGIADRLERASWVTELRGLQQDDGGWSLSALGAGQWSRSDGKDLDTSSDAYATAFTVFVLRQARAPKRDPAIQRGVAWLKSRQRASGRWYVRSPRRDGKHYISHAATHLALMALQEVEEQR
ncbi:MAG: hypothetical protein CMJ83_04855 [Planctomycetes bacterium]|nr:hypothetical protein [Planctomycetota bacterium]